MPEDIPPPGLTPTNYQRTTGGNLQWKPPTPERLAAMLPQYEVEALVGHGGMGAVYKGRQKSLDRAVAIKILPPEAAGNEDAQFVERFKNEARTMAKLNHPGIVHVYDFGETSEGQLYIVMEFIDGTDVSKMILTQGKLPQDHALAITAHVCDALHYAHTHNVIHRDIKPANIMINREGTVKVADFGLAKASDPNESGLTKTSMAMGTPDYVSPEALVAGMSLDGRADLYAVGVMLYQMLTGNIPRGLWTMPSVMLKTDARFDAIISRAMQTDREARYQSAAELRRDLDVILTTPQAKQPQPAQKAVAHGPQQSSADAPARKEPAAKPVAQVPEKKSNTRMIFGVAAAVVIVAVAAFVYSGGGKKVVTADKPAEPTNAEPPPALINPKPAPKPATPLPTAPAPVVKGAASATYKLGDVLTFGGRRYQLLTEPTNWTKAQAKAEAMGGHLATITTKAEADFVLETCVSQLQGLGTREGKRQLLLGGQQLNSGGPWEWITGEPFDPAAWVGRLPLTRSAKARYITWDFRSRTWNYTADDAPYYPLVEWDDDKLPIAVAAPDHAGTNVKAAGVAPTMPAAAPTPPGTPAALAKPSLPGAVDLLASVNPERDAVSGSWTTTADGLAVRPGGETALLFQQSVPEEYDYEVEFTMRGGYRRCVLLLPLPQGTISWKMGHENRDPTWFAFGPRLDGLPPDASTRTEAAIQHEVLESDHRYRCVVEVRKEVLRALLDGEELVKWSGDFKRLGGENKPHYKTRRLGLASHKTAVTFHKVMLRPPQPPDPRLEQLAAGFQSRYEADVLKPFNAALSLLNQNYIGTGLSRARAAAQARGALPEVTALDAEKTAIEEGDGVPADDAADTPAALKALRATYRAAHAKIAAERATKTAPLNSIYIRALDGYIAELTKAGKVDEAKRVQSLRDAKAADSPSSSTSGK